MSCADLAAVLGRMAQCMPSAPAALAVSAATHRIRAVAPPHCARWRRGSTLIPRRREGVGILHSLFRASCARAYPRIIELEKDGWPGQAGMTASGSPLTRWTVRTTPLDAQLGDDSAEMFRSSPRDRWYSSVKRGERRRTCGYCRVAVVLGHHRWRLGKADGLVRFCLSTRIRAGKTAGMVSAFVPAPVEQTLRLFIEILGG